MRQFKGLHGFDHQEQGQGHRLCHEATERRADMIGLGVPVGEHVAHQVHAELCRE